MDAISLAFYQPAAREQNILLGRGPITRLPSAQPMPAIIVIIPVVAHQMVFMIPLCFAIDNPQSKILPRASVHRMDDRSELHIMAALAGGTELGMCHILSDQIVSTVLSQD